jgi:Leu/Phe-tRNA-protein transferase
MLVKLHKERSIMEDIAHKLHIEKKTRKLARRYEVTLDTAFEQVVEKVWAQHGHNWLFPVLARTFKRMHDANGSGEFRASVHSVEVWKQGELVSGELGFTIGGVYNSLTGFTGESNAGKVQLAALGELLALNGVSHWDLGMVMDYTLRLGAEQFPRARFLATHVRARDRVCQLRMPQTQPVNARDLLDRKLSLEAQETQ